MVRVKPSKSAAPEFQLSLHDGAVDLMRGFSLSSYEGIGSAWKAPSSAETFDAALGDGELPITLVIEDCGGRMTWTS